MHGGQPEPLIITAGSPIMNAPNFVVEFTSTLGFLLALACTPESTRYTTFEWFFTLESLVCT